MGLTLLTRAARQTSRWRVVLLWPGYCAGDVAGVLLPGRNDRLSEAHGRAPR